MPRMPPPLALALLWCALFLSSSSLAFHCSINVVAPGSFHSPTNDSPTLTSLHRAAEFVSQAVIAGRTSMPHSPIAVCIFGRHILSRPLVLRGPYPHSPPFLRITPPLPALVQWIGFDAEISGAVPLLSWTKVAGCNATFATKLPLSFAGAIVRNLWAAGHRANRSAFVSPEVLLGTMTAWDDGCDVGFETEKDVPEEWAAAVASGSAIEMVWPVVIANWMEPRCCIANISRRNITLTRPCGTLLLKRNTLRAPLPPPVIFEAVPNLRPQPGCFYHDASTRLVYYTLLPSDSVADLNALSFTSSMQSLLLITNVSHHTWSNVTFTASTWFQPNAPSGYVDLQSCVYFTEDQPGAVAEPPAAVSVSSSSDITFTSCTFKALGSPYALSAGSGSSRVSVTNCVFSDLSGGAVMFGNILGSHDEATDSLLLMRDCVVAGAGLQYSACAAVFAGYVFSTTIESNTISDTAYSAISMGWGWGLSSWTGYGNNTISKNRFLRVMTTLRDGGAVYVNGHTNPNYRNSIDSNWCDADAAVYAVFYLDNGSSQWDVKRNVATGSPVPGCFFMTGGGAPSGAAANSSVSYIWCRDTSPGINDCYPQGCVVDNSTLFYIKIGDPLPAEAQKIVDGSGARQIDIK